MATATVRRKRRRRRSRRNRVLWGLSAFVAVLIVLLLIAASLIFLWLRPYRNYQYILPNVYYNGANLGGLTREEALDAITGAQDNDGSFLVLQFSDGLSFDIDPCRTYHNDDVNAVLDVAMSYGRSASETPMSVYRAVQVAKRTLYEIPYSVTFEYDQEAVRRQVEEAVEQIQVPPEAATGTGSSENRTISITPGLGGRSADPEVIFHSVCSAIEATSSQPVKAEYTNSGADVDQLRDLVDQLYDAYTIPVTDPTMAYDENAHTVTITNGVPGYSFNKDTVVNLVERHVENSDYTTVVVQMDEMMPETVDLYRISDEVSTQPTEVEYHDGGLTGGESGYVLDVEAARAELETCGWGESRTIALTAVEPKQSREEVEALLFRDVLGKSDTAHTYDYNRTANLELACAELDGIVLNAGATFSFNTFVGERTAERGFRTGVVYVDGSSDVETGGGICQVASTVYLAALYAGMEITDRANHEFLITYAPGGLDATVYWGVQDLCFRNNTNYPIRINASVSGGYVHVSIEGTNENGYRRTLGSNRVSTGSYDTIGYQAYQYVYDKSGYLVETNDLGISYYSTKSH